MANNNPNADLPDFPSPFQLGDYGDGFPCQTIKEQLIFRLLMTIRQKDDWIRKVNDHAIVAKWKEEVCSAAATADVSQAATVGVAGQVRPGEGEMGVDASRSGGSRPETTQQAAGAAGAAGAAAGRGGGGEGEDVLASVTPMRVAADPPLIVDEDIFNYAIKELQWQAATYAGSSVLPSPVEGVYLMLPHTVAQALTSGSGGESSSTAGPAAAEASDKRSGNDTTVFAPAVGDTRCSTTTASVAADAPLAASPASTYPPCAPPSTSPLSVLLAALSRLEDVPEGEVDYHPGSSNQVVDLVHPSLYCLVYGRTRVRGGGEDEVREGKEREAHGGCDSQGSRGAATSATAVTAAAAVGAPDAPVTAPAASPDATAAGTAAAAPGAANATSSAPVPVEGRSSTEDSQGRCVAQSMGGRVAGSTPPLGFSWDSIMGSAGAGKGTIAVAPAVGIGSNGYTWVSRRFQWLPSEVDVADDGSTATFRSYVNNLHPGLFPDAYAAMGDIFARCFVPLFNRVLTDLANPRGNRIMADPYGWYRAWEKENNCDPVSFEGEEDEDELLDEYYARRQPQQPAVPSFEPPCEPMHVVDLRGRRVQVIVKVASIRLRPGEGEYKGGVWHIEGMKNESVVATGILYLDVSNVEGSKLQFRRAICEPDYEQSDNRGVRKVYGLLDEDPLVQYCGYVKTDTSGLCLAFPNLYQHKVAPFSLRDPTKPEHRKILAFFLVDPKTRVTSTENVPPQQASWHRMEMERDGHPCAVLPSLALDLIVQRMSGDEESGVMSEEEAKRVRVELMSERKAIVDETTGEVFEREFSLCEH